MLADGQIAWQREGVIVHLHASLVCTVRGKLQQKPGAANAGGNMTPPPQPGQGTGHAA